MITNRHYTPLLTSLLCFLAILLAPLFSAMFRIAPPPSNLYIPLGTIRSLQQMGVPGGGNGGAMEFPWLGVGSASAFSLASGEYRVHRWLGRLHGSISTHMIFVFHDL